MDVINSVDSLYDIADNNTISKMYCYQRLYFNIIKNECFKEPNINRKKIKKLFNKFLYSPYIIISKKKYQITNKNILKAKVIIQSLFSLFTLYYSKFYNI